MDLHKLRGLLKGFRVGLIYTLIASVLFVAFATNSPQLRGLSINVMMGVIFALVGVVAVESITASMIKAKSRGHVREHPKKVVEGGRTDKIRSGVIDFTEGKKAMNDEEDDGKISPDEEDEWLKYILSIMSSFPRSDVLAGLVEILVMDFGKDKAIEVLDRDVDKESLEASYKSFLKSISRDNIEEFIYESENIIRMFRNELAVIKSLIESVVRDFGDEKKDLVYAVLAKYARSLR